MFGNPGSGVAVMQGVAHLPRRIRLRNGMCGRLRMRGGLAQSGFWQGIEKRSEDGQMQGARNGATRHISEIGEEASTAQRSRWLPQ